MLEVRQLDPAVGAGDADGVAERPDGFRRDAPAAHPGEGRHARVVPPIHMPLGHQPQQFPLAHDCIVQHQPGEFGLLGRPLESRLPHQPVVNVPVVLEFQGTERVSDPLDRVRKPVGKIVEGVDAPGVAPPVVMGVPDPQKQRVAHGHVGMGQVDPGSQHVGSVRELPRAHPAQQIQILLHRAVPIPARRPRGFYRSAMPANLLFRFTIDVGLPLPDQPYRDVVELLEVVAGVELLVPLETQPANVFLECSDILHVFGGRVGIVEAQVHGPVEFLRDPEIQADGLGVADMRKPVGLGRKTGAHRPAEFTAGHVPRHHFANEVPTSRVLGHANRFSARSCAFRASSSRFRGGA